MKSVILAIFVCTLFGTGCASRVQVNANSNTAAALIAIGLLSAAVPPSERAPELAPDRRVNEQDCTRPIDFTSGNLRCK